MTANDNRSEKGHKDMSNDVAEQAKVRAPWIFGNRAERHRGVEVDNDGQPMTVSQAIKAGGLDWMVQARDPVSNDSDAIEAPDWQQIVKVENVVKDGETVREYRTLGMVGTRYTILQNRDAFSFFDRATLDGAAIIQAVGHLDYGRVVWAVARRTDAIEIAPGDVIYPQLVLVTAHDGSHAVKVMFSPYRTSTGTMLGVKTRRRQRTQVKVRHTASIDERMLDLHNILAAETDFFEHWRAALVGDEDKPGFKQKLVTQDEVRKVVSALCPVMKKVDEDGKQYEELGAKAEKARQLIIDRIVEQRQRSVKQHAEAGTEAPNGPTQLDVFLGVCEYADKDKTVRNNNNWVASTFGTGAEMRQKAFDLISGL